GAARLIRRAREARNARAEGLRSFELTFRERLYAGLQGELSRRERALYHQERAARVHWRAGGDRVIRWLGIRRGVPIAGILLEPDEDRQPGEDEDGADLDFDFLDPAGDRLFLGADWALHPLADSAYLHYRFRSGDTLRIRVAGLDRTVTLVEAIVRPREARFDRIVGSLWFDEETAVLARAVYRPARPYDFESEEPEDADEVPGFLKPIGATVEYITVDYGLQELRWWLPNRMAFDGTASLAGLARMPIRLEWTFEDYEVGGPETLDPGEDALPAGWSREVRRASRDEDEAGRAAPDSAGPVATDSGPRIVVLVPPGDSLRASPALPEPLFSGSVQVFSDEELDELRSRLDELSVPAPPLVGPRLAWGLSPGLLRFNRVEGLSPGTRFSVPTGAVSRLEATARIGVPEWEPGVELRWVRETPSSTVAIGAFRRLSDLGDWGRPLGFGNSVNSLLLGTDYGLYFRETGLELFGSRTGSRVRWEGRLFATRHQTAPKTTDASLPAAFGDRAFPENLAALRGEVAGASGRVRAFSGVDPADPIVSATVWGEATAGDFDYARAALSGALVTPLIARLTGALEVAAGSTFGRAPTQRLWYLGGPHTLRGFEVGSAAGEAFWLARAELGLGFRVSRFEETRGGGAVRAIAFADAGWAGPRDDLGAGGWKAGLGGGVSILDGLLRIDLARGVRGGNDWRLLLYADGLR
ncbi:MAG: hypothetical protein ACRELC_11150, partial [Gemmatimonadota bacterium]